LEESWKRKAGQGNNPDGGRDRDRTDDLYRVNLGQNIYLIDSSSSFLHGVGSFSLVFGAYCSQIVPKFYEEKN
jgi:hypothetical protein